MRVLVKMKAVFYVLYYRCKHYRTHEVFLAKDRNGLYVGARRHHQSPKNVFHLDLKRITQET